MIIKRDLKPGMRPLKRCCDAAYDGDGDRKRHKLGSRGGYFPIHLLAEGVIAFGPAGGFAVATKRRDNGTQRIRAILGFRFQTAYLSVAYFDQFLSRRSINRGNSWAIRLLSVACLRVAAKMEECTVPLLEFFGTEQCDLYKFESNVVQRMELLVLSTLEWNMRLVTPFAYISCFVVKCCRDQSIRSIISRFEQILMASMRDINLMSHRPSVIALAATLVALDSKLTVPELELNIIAHSPFPRGFLKMADIVSCYNRTKELINIEILTASEYIVPQSLSRLECGEQNFFESYVISGIGNKKEACLRRP